jgi:hypothetical protein
MNVGRRKKGATMNIGERRRTIYIEPIEDPDEEPGPAVEPEPSNPPPETEPEPVR